jgi:hypothetical protein
MNVHFPDGGFEILTDMQREVGDECIGANGFILVDEIPMGVTFYDIRHESVYKVFVR